MVYVNVRHTRGNLAVLIPGSVFNVDTRRSGTRNPEYPFSSDISDKRIYNVERPILPDGKGHFIE